jgi:hypothetical protein
MWPPVAGVETWRSSAARTRAPTTRTARAGRAAGRAHLAPPHRTPLVPRGPNVERDLEEAPTHPAWPGRRANDRDRLPSDCPQRSRQSEEGPMGREEDTSPAGVSREDERYGTRHPGPMKAPNRYRSRRRGRGRRAEGRERPPSRKRRSRRETPPRPTTEGATEPSAAAWVPAFCAPVVHVRVFQASVALQGRSGL